MVARADSPGGQGVLLYLYTHDLPALQTHLRAHAQPAGAIRDGTPGPRQEMRLRDPDGYLLMVAQLEEHWNRASNFPPTGRTIPLVPG
jgi:hypothetical protein